MADAENQRKDVGNSMAGEEREQRVKGFAFILMYAERKSQNI